ncbi:MAG: hypothetical protein ACYTHK_04190 [Planctomycetota bacterium]|jgi:hypothetical protein
MLYPVLLTIASLAVLLVPPAIQAPDPPLWVPISLFVAGAAWSWALFFYRPARTAMLLGLLQVAVGGAMAWWVIGLSSYVAPDGAPRESAPAPDIEAVRVADGAEFRLSAQRTRPVVMVFFRGTW